MYEVTDCNTTVNMKRLLCILSLVATAMAASDSEAIFKKSNDQFSASMFQEMIKHQEDQNFVLSAFSVLFPLAQLSLASVGESHDEILKAIGFLNDNVTKQVFLDLNSKLRSVKGVDLELANKIYVSKQFSLNYIFAASSKKIFNSEIENIDFQQKAKAAAEINAWVEDHTHKRIKDLVKPDSINNKTAAILVNAIYFMGKWEKPFVKYLTGNRSFHVTKNLTSHLPMMSQTGYFKYIERKEFGSKFLQMDFKGDQTSFVVALPDKIDGIKDLIKQFKDPLTLNKALKNIYYEKVDVYLPKFKIETTTNLVDVLEKMNITKLFGNKQAKLYNLLKETKELYVSKAVQKAFIELNEEGVLAAASNKEYVMVGESENEEKPKEFKADHPFLFFIKEKENILFSGVFSS